MILVGPPRPLPECYEVNHVRVDADRFVAAVVHPETGDVHIQLRNGTTVTRTVLAPDSAAALALLLVSIVEVPR